MPLTYEDQADQGVTIAGGTDGTIIGNVDDALKMSADITVPDGTQIETWNDDILEVLKNIRTELRAIRLYLNLASLDTVSDDDLMEDLEE